jgi:glycosyltransferase involved in cell wall biosynthesis/SAM-dependent methyltransferase
VRPAKEALVSVIVPCYNQGHFLPEAIESALKQTYKCFEIIVVDDGSTDNTAEVAASYPGLRYVHQTNQGLAAARNTGILHSTGAYLVFLDADDRLLPNALECGVDYLNTHPQCVFVSGHYRYIAANGTVLPTWLEQRLGQENCVISGDSQLIGADGAVRRTIPRQRIASDHYTALLQRNYIAMHATVMYRRTVFDAVGGFDPSLRACEDYECYLRIARQFPIACHNQVIAEYRRHEHNMTHNSGFMLTWALAVLHSQWVHVAGKPVYETAYKIGEKFWQHHYAKQSLKEALAHLKTGALVPALQATDVLRRYGWSQLYWAGQHALMVARRRLNTGWQRLHRWPIGPVDFGTLRRVVPFNSSTSTQTGQSVEHYYLDRFLSCYAESIQGDVLEIGQCAVAHRLTTGRQLYTGAVSQSPENPPRITIVDDLPAVDGLPADSYDCLILPHCLQRVYELQAAIRTAYRLLRPGGVLLATFPGISIYQPPDTAYWACTAHLAQRLFAEAFPPLQLTVETYGNVLAAMAFLYGIPAQELRPEELNYRDLHYQMLVAVRAVKPRKPPITHGRENAITDRIKTGS